MQSLEQHEWESRFRGAFASVFRSTDAFDTPLASTLEAKALIYPVHYLLEREQFDAFVEAARSAGDDAICLSVTEGFPTQPSDQQRHWLLEFWDFEEYQELTPIGVLENALYSPDGQWGMLISHEQHALVGGSRSFMSTLATAFPDFELSIAEFVATWCEARERDRVDTGWIVPAFEHLYGRAQTAALLPGVLRS